MPVIGAYPPFLWSFDFCWQCGILVSYLFSNRNVVVFHPFFSAVNTRFFFVCVSTVPDPNKKRTDVGNAQLNFWPFPQKQSIRCVLFFLVWWLGYAHCNWEAMILLIFHWSPFTLFLGAFSSAFFFSFRLQRHIHCGDVAVFAFRFICCDRQLLSTC